MSIALYMDVHVHRAITTGLRLRDVDVLTAQEDGYRTASDDVLLDRASELQRVLFSQDEDLLAEATRRQPIPSPIPSCSRGIADELHPSNPALFLRITNPRERGKNRFGEGIGQREGVSFGGVVYGHQLRVTIGDCVRDLEIIAKAADPEDLANRVEYLPL